MPPRRRSVLRAIATAGLATGAGCAAAERGDDPDTPTVTALPVETPVDTATATDDGASVDDDYYPEPTPVAEPSAEVAVASVRDGDGPIAYDFEVVQSTATTKTAPRLAVEVRNASARRVGVGESRAMRFWAARAGDPHELVLLPLEYGGSIAFMDGAPSPAGSCWHLDSRVVQTTEYRFETLEPGESFGSTLQVWWQGPVDTCFPTGTFAFGTDYEAWDPEDGRAPGDGDRFRVEFALDVDRP